MKRISKIILLFLLIIFITSCKTQTRIVSSNGIYINDEVSQQHKQNGNYIELKINNGLPVSGKSFVENSLKSKIYFNKDGLFERMETMDKEIPKTKTIYSYENKNLISDKTYTGTKDKFKMSIDYIYKNGLLYQMIFSYNSSKDVEQKNIIQFKYEETLLTIFHLNSNSKHTFIEKIYFKKDEDQRKKELPERVQVNTSDSP